MQFSSSTYSASEIDKRIIATVTRSGSTASAASADYSTTDPSGANACSAVTGLASSRCDYLQTVGTVNFAAGETSKDISILVVDDAYAEGNETFSMTLTNVAAMSSWCRDPIPIMQ